MASASLDAGSAESVKGRWDTKVEQQCEALFPARCWHRGQLKLRNGCIVARYDKFCFQVRDSAQRMGVPVRLSSAFYRLIHLASPRAWLAICLLSSVLAVASAWVLISHHDRDSTDQWYSLYDSVARFAHDTIRLTFKTDGRVAAVFVAPIGILNPNASFIWVQDYPDFQPRPEDVAPRPLAPTRLLDSDWNPVFSRPSGPKDF
jgi:hypothetical protein